jgi:hypothetical protein
MSISPLVASFLSLFASFCLIPPPVFGCGARPRRHFSFRWRILLDSCNPAPSLRVTFAPTKSAGSSVPKEPLTRHSNRIPRKTALLQRIQQSHCAKHRADVVPHSFVSQSHDRVVEPRAERSLALCSIYAKRRRRRDARMFRLEGIVEHAECLRDLIPGAFPDENNLPN